MSKPTSTEETMPVTNPSAAPIRLWVVADHEGAGISCATALGVHGIPCEQQFESAEAMIVALQQTSGLDLLLMGNRTSMAALWQASSDNAIPAARQRKEAEMEMF